jgi:glycosyltransferase involved in cell wall biosynthesis
MKKIIFDSSAHGHHLEYIVHLLRCLKSKPKQIKEQYIFVVNPSFFEILINLFPNDKFNNITIVELSKDEYYRTSARNNKQTIFNSVRATKELSRLMVKYKAEECVLLCFDDFFRGLVFNALFKFRITAIWFQPFVRIPENNFRNRLRKIIKKNMMRIVLFFNKIDRIFILNDKQTVQSLNDIYVTKVFRLLRDPINISVDRISKSLPKASEAKNKKNVFLLFGSITKRKGTLILLEALKGHLSDKISKTIKIMIVGNVPDHFKKEFYTEIERTRLLNKDIEIIIDDRFINFEEIPQIFSKSDYVLAPYINFFGSSGVLGYSAYFNKPIICSDNGLMADLVKEYNLGYLVKPNPTSLGLIISKLVSQNKIELSERKSFVEDHSIESFTNTILHSI